MKSILNNLFLHSCWFRKKKEFININKIIKVFIFPSTQQTFEVTHNSSRFTIPIFFSFDETDFYWDFLFFF